MHRSESYWSRVTIYRPRRRQVLGIAMSGAGAALAGCGSIGRSAGAKSGSQSANQASQAKYGGQLNVAMADDPADLDPSHKPSENKQPLRLVYDELLSLKTTPAVSATDFALQPGLADKWEVPDGQTFIFHLHPGAKFADLPPVNGREFSSADAKWSIEYLSRTGDIAANKKLQPALYAYIFQGMDKLETPDASTLSLHFSAPFVPFLNYIAQYYSPMLPHEVYDRDGNFSKTIAGTGPWQLDTTQSQRGSHWVYKKNPNYFMTGKPYIDQINWLVISDDQTQRAAFQTGQFDFLGADYTTLTPKELPGVLKNSPQAKLATSPGTEGGVIWLNNTQPPLTDERVRQAMQLCIDRSEYVNAVGGGDETWAIAGALPGLYTQKEMEGLVHYDPAEAKKLLSAAGYENSLQLEILNGGVDRGQREVTMIQLFIAQMQRAGITVLWHPLDKATEGKRRKTRQFQLDIAGGGAKADEDEALYGDFYSKSAHNYAGVNDPALDKLVVAQRQEVDPAKRSAICKQACELILKHGYQISFFFPNSYQLFQPYVKNYGTNMFVGGLWARDSWLEK